jgi:hypothetical protein
MSTEKKIISAIKFTGTDGYTHRLPWVRLMNMDTVVSKVIAFDNLFSGVDELATERAKSFRHLLGSSSYAHYAPSYRSFRDLAEEKNLDSDALLRMVLAPRDVARFVFPDEDRKQMQAKAVFEFENAVNSLADMVERICSDPDAVKEIPVMAANELNSIDAKTSASGPFLAVDNGEVVLRAFWNVYSGDDWSKASYRAEINSFMGDHGWVDWTPFEQVRAVDYEHYCHARMKVSQEVARRAQEAMNAMKIYAPEMFTTSFTAHALSDLMNNTTVIDLLDSDNLYNEEDWMP